MKKEEDEHTMFAVRLTKSKTEILWLVLILALFFAILVVLGGVQYIFCLDKNPDVGLIQCFSRGLR